MVVYGGEGLHPVCLNLISNPLICIHANVSAELILIHAYLSKGLGQEVNIGSVHSIVVLS